MGCNECWAKIEFPATALRLPGVRELLTVQYDVEFKENGLPAEEEDREIGISGGIFSISGQVCYGEYAELEAELKAKGVPFDRETGHDYQVYPELKVFRPAPENFEHSFQLDEDGRRVIRLFELQAAVVNKVVFRADGDDPFPAEDAQAIAKALKAFLLEKFPPYQPLENYVPEIIAEKEKIKAALAQIETVDFSRFPGLYDLIPWEKLEEAAK